MMKKGILRWWIVPLCLAMSALNLWSYVTYYDSFYRATSEPSYRLANFGVSASATLKAPDTFTFSQDGKTYEGRRTSASSGENVIKIVYDPRNPAINSDLPVAALRARAKRPNMPDAMTRTGYLAIGLCFGIIAVIGSASLASSSRLRYRVASAGDSVK